MNVEDMESPIPRWMPNRLEPICALFIIGAIVAFLRSLEAYFAFRRLWRR